MGTILGIAVGCLSGIAILIGIIVGIICLCKKKPARVWTVQPQQQLTGQTGFGMGSGQQWSPGFQPYPSTSSMNYVYPQPPPAYSTIQPTKMNV